MTIQEIEKLCGKCLINWTIAEQAGNDLSKHNKDIIDLFTSKILLKKFDVFNIDIVLPDALLVILYFCTQGNPGQVQIILKQLLLDIKSKNGPIPKGYIISAKDFSYCFANGFPIMLIPEINKKYEKLWDEQKRNTKNTLESNNLCDTPKWWLEVMED